MGATEGFKMFKLSELLRDYLRKEYPYSEYGVYLSKDKNLILEKSHSFMGYGIDEEWYEDVDFGENILISKSFGFVERLVEQDKIDIDKMEEKSEYTFIKNGGGEHIIEDVIMLLAVQDEPISFLISILK